jgi:hypothetical protein
VNINLNVNELVRSMVAKGTPFYDSDGNPLTAEQVLAPYDEKPEAIPSTATETPEKPDVNG